MTPLTILHLAANRWWTGSADPVIQLVSGLRARGHRVLLGVIPGDRFEVKAKQAGLELVEGLRMDAPRPARARERRAEGAGAHSRRERGHRAHAPLARSLAGGAHAAPAGPGRPDARRADLPQPAIGATRPARRHALSPDRGGVRGVADDRVTLPRGRHPAGADFLDPGLGRSDPLHRERGRRADPRRVQAR